MSSIERCLDVEVPVHLVYERWTRFSEFPEFMEGVEHVEELSATDSRWTTQHDAGRRTFDARLIELTPDRQVAWATLQRPRQAWDVRFDRLSDDRTRVLMQIDVDLTGPVESSKDTLALLGQRIQEDLERFKKVVEAEHVPRRE